MRGYGMSGKQKRIAFYYNSAFEGDSVETVPLGGMKKATIHMARELSKLGNAVSVFCDCKKEGLFTGVRYLNLRNMKDHLANDPADIFISEGESQIFMHSLNSRINVLFSGLNPDQRVVIGKDAIKKIDHYFFVSRWQAEQTIKKFRLDKNKVFITRNGYDPAFLADGIERIKYRMIYFSSPARGLDILVEIFPKIKKRFSSAELFVFSDYEFYGKPKGEGEKRYPEIYKKMDQPGIRSLGNIKHAELMRQLQMSYLMAYPTRFHETSCMAAIEAQAAGTPPVTSRIAALPETIEHGKTGVLIPGNPRTLLYKWRYLRAIFDLFEDEAKWQALSEAGKKRMNEDFTWGKIAVEWDSFFDTILKRTI
jgi:glycosyltransferase involved in cell wall biosynthesis